MAFTPVAALLKGLRTLEVVNEFGPIGLGGVLKKVGLPKATTLRMLETLCSEGYVDFDNQEKTYTVAARALALSNKFSSDDFLMRTAVPVMNELRSRLGWPSDLAIFQHNKLVIMDTNRTPGTLSTNRSVGSRVPVMASATGRAYLSFCSPEKQAEIIAALKDSDDEFESAAKDPERVRQIIEETVRRGYGVSDREFLNIHRSAAVPILVGDEVVCCINAITLADMVTIEELESKYVPMILEAKSEIEAKLNKHT